MSGNLRMGGITIGRKHVSFMSCVQTTYLDGERNRSTRGRGQVLRIFEDFMFPDYFVMGITYLYP